MMIRRTLLLTLLVALVGAVLPAAAQDTSSRYQGLGCYGDPIGDAGDPNADLIEVCVNYDSRNDDFVVVVDTDGANAPLSDPAWLDPSTALLVGFDTDGDGELDRELSYTRQGEAIQAVVGDAGTGDDPCDGVGGSSGGLLLAQVPRACLDEAPAIAISATLTYRPQGGAVAVDDLPDDGVTAPLPDDPPESPVCANPTADTEAGLTVRRVRCDIGGTEAISQAVATSQFVFDDPATTAIDPYQADWVVLARDDDFADALAGSALSFGQGPLLFTYSPTSGPALGQDPERLAAITRAEILRSLPRGRTVYLLGGVAAISQGVEDQLVELGYEIVRFAGTGREQTARLIAREVRVIVTDFSDRTGFPDTRMAFVVNSRNWPDAVLAGSVAAFWGMPILLTDAVSVHPETRAALEEMDIDYLHIAGGQAVIATTVLQEVRTYVDGRQEEGVDLADPNSPWHRFCINPQGGPEYGCRWGGDDRIATSSFIGQLNRDMLNRFGDFHPLIPDDQQQFAAVLNLRRPEAFTWALSAATVSGRFGGAVFVAAEGDAGTALRDDTKFFTCPYISAIDQVLFMGDTDVIAPQFEDLIRAHHADPTTSPSGCAPG